MTTTDADEFVDVAFTVEQLALIDNVAAARGCTSSEFILRESLARTREIIALSGAQPDCPNAAG